MCALSFLAPLSTHVQLVRRQTKALHCCAADAIEVGFGVFFSFLTIFLTWLEKKFGGVEITSEHFNTAGRNVKTGLTASVIVSQWTWAATLLQSSNVAWQYGITGPFWYAAGASIQVLVFGILAIEVKKKAPNAHTFLEMIYVRWGKTAHLTFMYFAIMTNVIVSSSKPEPALLSRPTVLRPL